MESVAVIKYLRISPKKIKGFSREVIGLPPKTAIDRLMFFQDKSARLLSKSIESVLSNASNNLKIEAANLKIKSVEVFKGPFFKRFQPVSRGMAHQVKKRTAHIKIVLEEIPKVTKEREAKKGI
jgi:large subunit ribosomal protein L22